MSSNSKSAARSRRRRFERMWRQRHGLERSFSKFEQQVATSVSQLELEPEDSSPYDDDLLAWARHFLPHHFEQPPSQMHREVAAILDAAASQRGSQPSVNSPLPSEGEGQG